MTTPHPSSNVQLLSRNPIFTPSMNVWGYEIQTAAHVAADAPPEPDQPRVGNAVISGSFVGLNAILARSKKLLLAYSADQLHSQIPRALPPKSSIVLVPPESQGSPGLRSALEQLAAEGHGIALDWDKEVTPHAAILGAASFICLTSPDQARTAELATILALGKTCIARHVHSREALHRLKGHGVGLFQGRFFKDAEIIPGKKLSSHQNSRLGIMNAVMQGGDDLDRLVQPVQSDVSLSYRLLSYLNSPSFGFVRKISTIRQAIAMLGWSHARNWLLAVLLADMAQGDQQNELLHLSLQRAKFLEQMVQTYDYWGFKPEEMFLLGTFSLLDVILGVSMQDALAFLPLNDTQKRALCGDKTSEYAPFLTLMAAFEDQDQRQLDKLALDLNINPDAARHMFHASGAWASSVLEATPGA
ncbi:MAG: HDOD domain-containing protein [Desulfovibrionales bacterium]|nr:HDOD domain-containing protein [Desulfovibrionales bacterium]